MANLGKRERALKRAQKQFIAEYGSAFFDVHKGEKEQKPRTEIVRVKSDRVQVEHNTLFSGAIECELPVLTTPTKRHELATHSKCASECKQNGIKDIHTVTCTEKAYYSGNKNPYAHDLHSVQSNDFGEAMKDKWHGRNKITDRIRRDNVEYIF